MSLKTGRLVVMPDHDGLMRIFWPRDIPRSDSPGIIVGWRNSGLDVFVVAILEDVEVSSILARKMALTDAMAGAQCRKCTESGYSIPKCKSSNRTDLRVMWTVITASIRLGKFT